MAVVRASVETQTALPNAPLHTVDDRPRVGRPRLLGRGSPETGRDVGSGDEAAVGRVRPRGLARGRNAGRAGPAESKGRFA